MNLNQVKSLRDKLDRILNDCLLGSESGLARVEVGKIKYNDTGATITIEVKEKARAGQAEVNGVAINFADDRAARQKLSIYGKILIPPTCEAIGSFFETRDGNTVRLMGFERSRPKYSFRIMTSGGKTSLCHASYLTKLVKGN